MKKYLPIMVLSLLILGGCGTTASTSVVAPTATPTAKTETARTALKELLAGGKTQICTWTSTENGVEMKGTLYVSGKKFRQESETTDAKTKTVSQSFSISDGESIYSWGGAMGKQGVKFSMSSIGNIVTGTPTGASSRTGVNLNQEYQYQCQPWTADETLFTPPADVTFSDMSSLINNLQKKFGGNVNIPSIPAGY
jgi:hypothetical protein